MPIVRQAYDQSCGLASLATLLNWGGYKVTERHLLGILQEDQPPANPGISREREQRGLSITELVQLVSSLGLGLELKPRYHSASQLRQAVRREALIIFTLEPASGSQEATGHFTIIAGYSPTRGYLRADSLDASYSFQKEEDLLRSSQIWEDGTRTAVLSLRKNDVPIALAEKIGEEEEAQTAEFSISRLFRTYTPIDKGRTQIGISSFFNRTDIEESAGGQSLRLRSDSASMIISVRHGLTARTEIFGEIATRSERDYLSLLGENEFVFLGHSHSIGPIRFGFLSEISTLLSQDFSTSVGADISLNGRGQLDGGGMNATLVWSASERLLISQALAVSLTDTSTEQNGPYVTRGTASLGVAYTLSPDLLVGGNLDFSVDPQRTALRTVTAQAFVERAFSRNTTIGAFAAVTQGGRRKSDVTLGLSVGYTLPRMMTPKR